MENNQIIYKTGNLLGITPAFDFKNCKITFNRTVKIYAVVKFLIVTSSVIWSHREMSKSELLDYHKEGKLNWGTTLNGLMELFVIILQFTVTVKLLINSDLWLAMFENFQKIDRKLMYKYTSRSASVVFATGNFIIVIICVIIGSRWRYLFSINIYIILERCYSNYYIFYTHVLFSSLLVVFKLRYETINKLLAKEIEFGKFIFEINDITANVRTLSDNVQFFNRIFGWPFLIVIGHCVLRMLFSLDTVIFLLKSEQAAEALFPVAFLFLSSVFGMTMTFALILLSHETKNESFKTLRLIYELIEKAPFNLKNELVLLKDFMKDEGLAIFSAAGFFDVDRTTLLTLVGSTTTYLIIVLQFEK